MTKIERLKAFLNEYLPYVDHQVPTEISMGGCAVFALHFSDQLDRMHIKHTIQAIVWDSYSDEWAEQQIGNLMKITNTGKGEYSMTEGHVTIQIEGELFDADGSLCQGGSFKEGFPRIKKVIEITKPILLKQIEKGAWVPIFDKSQEPLIKHLLSHMPHAFMNWEAGKYPPVEPGVKKLNKYTKQKMFEQAMSSPLFAVLAEMSSDSPETEDRISTEQDMF